MFTFICENFSPTISLENEKSPYNKDVENYFKCYWISENPMLVGQYVYEPRSTVNETRYSVHFVL